MKNLSKIVISLAVLCGSSLSACGGSGPAYYYPEGYYYHPQGYFYYPEANLNDGYPQGMVNQPNCIGQRCYDNSGPTYYYDNQNPEGKAVYPNQPNQKVQDNQNQGWFGGSKDNQTNDQNQNKGWFGSSQDHSRQDSNLMRQDNSVNSQDQNPSRKWFNSDNTRQENVNDGDLVNRIRQALNNTPNIGMDLRSIQVTSDQGKVTLKGSVVNDNQKSNVENFVKSLPGVKSVDNQLTTQK